MDWAYGHNSLSLKRPEPTIPEEVKADPQKKREWYKEWSGTPRGKAFLEAQRKSSRHYAIKTNDDGSFRVEDIPAGDYELSISAHEPPPGRQ